jgi:hypothetical protein
MWVEALRVSLDMWGAGGGEVLVVVVGGANVLSTGGEAEEDGEGG